MTGRDRDERGPADFDRVFAEMTAGWSSTEDDAGPDRAARSPDEPGAGWATGHPLFRRPEDADPGRSDPGRSDTGRSDTEETEELFRYTDPPEPEPAPEVDDGWFERPEITPIPWASLSLTALVGGLLMAFTIGVLLLSVLGLRLPTVVGYLAVASFVAGFGLLMTRLRRGVDGDPPGGGARL